MTTDFNYNNKTIDSGGPIKPSGTDQPGDPRTRVDFYSDIKLIPNPYVGMIITVKTDETNQNKMTDYKVLSLKPNSLGIANSVIDRVQRYVEYLGASSGGSVDLSGYATKDELNSKANTSDIPTNTSELYNDSGFLTSIPSEYVTETEMNEAIANVSSGGNVSQEEINTAVNNYFTEHPVSSGATAEQAAQIQANKTAIGDTNSGLIKKVNDIENIKLQNLNTAIQTLEALVGVDETVGDKTELPSGDANVIASINRIDSKTLSANNILISPDNSRFKLIVDNSGNLSTEKINEYGQIILSTEALTINEGESGSFKVKLNSAPTQDEVINLSVDNSNCTVSPTQLTFNSTNYGREQTVTINTTLDSSSYDDKRSVITLSNDNINSKTVNVTIVNTDVRELEVASIKLNKETSSLKVGETETLTYTLSPEGATSTVTWSTDRDSVVSVNNGEVQGISAGTAIITATTSNNKTDSCTFTITDNTVVTDPDNLFTESCLDYTVKGTENGRTGYYKKPTADGSIIRYPFDSSKGYTIKATLYDYHSNRTWRYVQVISSAGSLIKIGTFVDNGDDSYTYTINATAGELLSDSYIKINSSTNEMLIYDISIKES